MTANGAHPGEDAPGGAETAAAVAELLRARGATLAVAESCTGGLVAATLTELPGASAWFRGGIVAYHDALKTGVLDVARDCIATHGAVSGPVARALAEGVRRRAGADLGLGVTGIAGPGGGTAAKPVGLVHAAVADDRGTVVHSTRLPGDRGAVRRATVRWVLGLLHARLVVAKP